MKNPKSNSELEKLVDEKFRQWRMSTGSMSVMIDEMPDEQLYKIYQEFEEEAKLELKIK